MRRVKAEFAVHPKQSEILYMSLKAGAFYTSVSLRQHKSFVPQWVHGFYAMLLA